MLQNYAQKYFTSLGFLLNHLKMKEDDLKRIYVLRLNVFTWISTDHYMCNVINPLNSSGNSNTTKVINKISHSFL
jgi:hypothetical protein